MPQVTNNQVVREIVSRDNEVTVRIELTLNINTTADGQVQVQADATTKPAEKKLPEKRKFEMPDTDFLIPEFETTTELMDFGREAKD